MQRSGSGDARLAAVAGLLRVGTGRVIDIGCEAGHLAAHGLDHRWIGVERRRGPLRRCHRRPVCLADGLRALAPMAGDQVVVAGIGETGIATICAGWTPPVGLRLVCCPSGRPGDLRVALVEGGWRLVAEDLLTVGGRWYRPFACEWTGVASPIADRAPALLIGPGLLHPRHPLLDDWAADLRRRHARARRAGTGALRRLLDAVDLLVPDSGASEGVRKE